MTIKEEILNSGTLEAHALAVNSEEEEQLISSLASKYPEVEMAIDESREILENLALNQSVSLPDNFKDKIRSQLIFKEPYLLEDKNQTDFFSWKNVSIAASIAALFSFGTTIYMSQKAKTAETALQVALQQKELLVSETNYIRDQKFEISQQLSFVLGSEKKTIVMKGQAFSPQSQATVYWSGKEVYLFANNFPKNEIGLQYQLWAIVDGKPVDAGVFDVNETQTGLIKLKSIQKAQTFAVTLEKLGGSKAPSLNKMMVLGNV